MHDRSSNAPPLVAVVAAFAAIYSIWGSTYLAIRVGVETIPPFMLGGVRFLIAGGVLYAWTRSRGAVKPTLVHWRSAAIVGGLLLLGGNGGVCWAEQYVESGVAALLVASVPLWMILLNWLRPGGVRPRRLEILGLLMGFGGVVMLVNPESASETGRMHFIGQGVLVLASLFWAIGSLYSRQASLPKSPLLSTAMQMVCGGALLAIVSFATGEWSTLNPQLISRQSVIALVYLIVFGALVGFTAYMWLLRVSTPAKVSTYAYVNPVVAVWLGWAILKESLNGRTFLAMGIIVSAVILITIRKKPQSSPTTDNKMTSIQEKTESIKKIQDPCASQCSGETAPA